MGLCQPTQILPMHPASQHTIPLPARILPIAPKHTTAQSPNQAAPNLPLPRTPKPIKILKFLERVALISSRLSRRVRGRPQPRTTEAAPGPARELVQGDFVVRAAGKSRAHKVRDERGRLLEEAAERGGLERLGKGGEKSGVQSAEGGEVGERAAEDHVRLVLDLAAGAEAAHALRALEAHASGAAPRRRRGRDALLRRGRARGRRRQARRLHAPRRRGIYAGKSSKDCNPDQSPDRPRFR